MNERDFKFSKIVIFYNKYKNLKSENAIRWPWCVPMTYIKKCTLTQTLILESVLKLKKCHFSSLQTILIYQVDKPKTDANVKRFNEWLIE